MLGDARERFMLGEPRERLTSDSCLFGIVLVMCTICQGAEPMYQCACVCACDGFKFKCVVSATW